MSSPRALVIGHRGASAYEYENSRAAFRAARARGADAVELDIHASADGALFVHHDEVVSGVHITRADSAQVRALRLPNGESVPTLEDALAAIRAETEDRYGRIPESVEDLFAYARLRQAAEEVGVISIDRAPSGIAIKLSEKARVAPEKLMEMIRVRDGASFTPSGVLRLELNDEERDEVLAVARRVLLQIRADG